MNLNDLYVRYRDHGDEDAFAAIVEKLRPYSVRRIGEADADRVFAHLRKIAFKFDETRSSVAAWSMWLGEKILMTRSSG